MAAPRRGFLRRLGASALGLSLAAAAVYAQTLALDPEEKSANLTTSGALGEEVVTSRFSVKVTKTALATSVDLPDATIETGNLFLVVHVSATSPAEPFRFRPHTAWLLTEADKTYKATDKVAEDATLLGKWVQAGWWIDAPLVFEVPKEALRGSELVLFSASDALVVDVLAPEAQIDLGLTGGESPVEHYSLAPEGT
ncbi:DUF4352 domain-containing protein [Herbidospora galbida]|uniref:DUF4352 domain-containing protein n=1 Tax=Herbidospora galbida TaxID=2575442 RepID=A0A4U3MMK7_9ACTN|nr:DUF4352 domain-containing protein [Herbidospora galbida]TKK90868.1 DUF4352 domain-containing protein [Herbidospora galbida]